MDSKWIKLLVDRHHECVARHSNQKCTARVQNVEAKFLTVTITTYLT